MAGSYDYGCYQRTIRTAVAFLAVYVYIRSMRCSPHEITMVLQDWGKRDQGALDRLMPLVMGELRQLANRYLAGERGDHTLQPTALVNEVYLKLQRAQVQLFQNRSQFFAFSALLMREILVDYARSHRAKKRGSESKKVHLQDFQELIDPTKLDLDTVLEVDRALTHLERIDPRQSQLVQLRFFGGLTFPESAKALGVSVATAERCWQAARLWLAQSLDSTV